MKKFFKNNKGFTLVELIIVIAIIAILSAVAAPQYIKYVDKSRWATDQDNAQIFLTAVQVAVADPDYTIDDTSSSNEYKFTSAGISPTAANSGNGLAKYLYDTGFDTSIKVTNTKIGNTTFTVTVSGNTVKGVWSGSHTP